MYVDDQDNVDASVEGASNTYAVFRSSESGDSLYVSGNKNVVMRESAGITYAVPMATGETIPPDYIDVTATESKDYLYVSGSKNAVIRESGGIAYAIPLATGETMQPHYDIVDATASDTTYSYNVFRSSEKGTRTSTYNLFTEKHRCICLMMQLLSIACAITPSLTSA